MIFVREKNNLVSPAFYQNFTCANIRKQVRCSGLPGGQMKGQQSPGIPTEFLETTPGLQYARKGRTGTFSRGKSYSQLESDTEKVENLLCFCTLYCTSFKVPSSQRKKVVKNLQFLCYLSGRVTARPRKLQVESLGSKNVRSSWRFGDGVGKCQGVWHSWTCILSPSAFLDFSLQN